MWDFLASNITACVMDKIDHDHSMIGEKEKSPTTSNRGLESESRLEIERKASALECENEPTNEVLPKNGLSVIPESNFHVQTGNGGKDDNPKFLNNKFSSPKAAKTWMYKNLVGVGLSFLLTFSTFLSLQSLQSSINSEGGLGLATLSILYLFFALAGFVTPGIIRLLGTKYSLLGGFVCLLLYVVANYYPSWYTLIPASVLLGFAFAPIWAAGNAHLVKIAVVAAPALGLNQEHLISYLVGIFFTFFQGSQIPGNLASSLIFFPYSNNQTSEESWNNDSESLHDDISATEQCGGITEGASFDKMYLYILSSVYLFLVVLGIILVLVLVDHFPIEREPNKSFLQKLKLYFGDPFVDLVKLMTNYRMVLVVPIATVNGLVQGFVFGTFTQVIVVECFGSYLVGFALIVHGVASALAGLLYSRLVKFIPRYFFFVSGGLTNIALLVFLLVWERTPSFLVVFLFVFLWGTADAVWNTLTTSLVGILFLDKSENAYSVHRIWLAIGLGIGFVIAEVLDLPGRCYFVLVVVALAVASSLVLEFKTQPKRALLSSCLSKSTK